MAIVRNYPMDYKTIKSSMIEHFKSQSQYADWDFEREGSTLNMLMEILSYNTAHNAFVANRLASELFIDTAQKRASVVSISRALDYIPKSASCAQLICDITINSFGDTVPAYLILPRGQEFTSSDDASFYVIEDTVAYPGIDNTLTFTDVTLYQGTRYNTMYEVDTANQTFTIANENVDLTTMQVTINGTVAQQIGNEIDIINVNADSVVYYVYEDYRGYYVIAFGDDSIGRSVSVGDAIEIDYVVSTGTTYNGVSAVNPTPISGYSDITVNVTSKASGGGPRESIQSIKRYAPKHFSAANRAVTTSDYKYLVERNFPYVSTAAVWGGEEFDNKNYGKVFISAIDSDGDTISVLQKEQIINFLQDFLIASLTVEFRDVELIDLYPVINLIIDPKGVNFTNDQIRLQVNAAIDEYGQEVRGFGQEYSATILSNYIQERVSGIRHIEITTNLNQIQTLDNAGVAQFNYDMPLYHPFEGYGHESDGVIRTSAIPHPSRNDIFYYFNDDGYGNVRLFTLKDNTDKTYVSRSAGVIDYANGIIKFNGIPGIDTTSLRVTTRPYSEIVLSNKNKILNLTSENTKVNIKTGIGAERESS